VPTFPAAAELRAGCRADRCGPAGERLPAWYLCQLSEAAFVQFRGDVRARRLQMRAAQISAAWSVPARVGDSPNRGTKSASWPSRVWHPLWALATERRETESSESSERRAWKRRSCACCACPFGLNEVNGLGAAKRGRSIGSQKAGTTKPSTVEPCFCSSFQVHILSFQLEEAEEKLRQMQAGCEECGRRL